MIPGIFELALIIFIAAVLGVAAKFSKQPVILAYLGAGVILGFLGFFHFGDKEIFKVFSDLGIMFLLFLVGMEINYTSLRMVGKASVIVGLGQILFTFIFGFFIVRLFGFAVVHSAYIAIALTFSSTVIVVKLLSEKRELSSLYGKISIGILLVQDFVAILLLIVLAGIQSGQGIVWFDLLLVIFKGVALFLGMLLLGRKIFPWIFDKIARSQELLFLVSLAWLFLLVTAVSRVGLSIEIGGFLAGLALANSSEHFQIASRIRPLRDFFIVVFFVILGSSIIFSDFSGLYLPIVALSLFVLVGNPLIVLILLGFMGYRKRTSFFAGMTMAQISEFSLVLAALGLRQGHITEIIVALITAVGIVTITASTYLIMYSDAIFARMKKYLSVFERKRAMQEGTTGKEFHKPIILIGFHRTGQSIAFSLPKEELLIIDFDPEIIKQLKEHNFDYMYGDISDAEIFEQAGVFQARLVISTCPDFETNLTLLSEISIARRAKTRRNGPRVIIRAEEERDAVIFYKYGADYVLLPHSTAGHYLGKIIATDPSMKTLQQLKKKDREFINKTAAQLSS